MVLKDILPKHQYDLMLARIGSKFLEMEIPVKSELLIEGVWKLSQEEKASAIEMMFGVDRHAITNTLKNFQPTEHFLEVFNRAKLFEHMVDLQNPSLLDLKILNDTKFRGLSIGETKADKVVVRDEDGRPIKQGRKFLYRDKAQGEIVFNNNKTNFNSFIESYNSAFDTKIINPFKNKIFTNIHSLCEDNDRLDFDLFNGFDMELYITSKPEDILNMSLSKFYDSCQNLYTGAVNNALPPNIFDKNSKVAFLRFNTPYTDVRGNNVDFTIFSRCIIRVIREQIYFDLVYPKHNDELKKFFHSIITKYTGMVNNANPNKGGRRRYYYTDVGLGRPYFDTVDGVPLKFNPNAMNDLRLQALAGFLNESPEYILPIPNIQDNGSQYGYNNTYFSYKKGKKKQSFEHIYSTEKGDYLVLTNDEANQETIKFLTEHMIYKQSIYLPYLDVERFVAEQKEGNGVLKNYEGGADFDEIVKWAESSPNLDTNKSMKDFENRIEKYGPNSGKVNLTKHNLYRALKPYLDPKFFEERTTPSKLVSKRRKLADDDIEIEYNGYFIYRQRPSAEEMREEMIEAENDVVDRPINDAMDELVPDDAPPIRVNMNQDELRELRYNVISRALNGELDNSIVSDISSLRGDITHQVNDGEEPLIGEILPEDSE